MLKESLKDIGVELVGHEFIMIFSYNLCGMSFKTKELAQEYLVQNSHILSDKIPIKKEIAFLYADSFIDDLHIYDPLHLAKRKPLISGSKKEIIASAKKKLTQKECEAIGI